MARAFRRVRPRLFTSTIVERRGRWNARMDAKALLALNARVAKSADATDLKSIRYRGA